MVRGHSEPIRRGLVAHDDNGSTSPIASRMPQTLPELLVLRGGTHGEKPAIIFGDRESTYSDLLSRSVAAARGLARRNVHTGGRVAVLARNCDWFYELLGAVGFVRACLLPLNHRLAPVELAWILADAQPSIVIADGDLEQLAEAALSLIDAPAELLIVRNNLLAALAEIPDQNGEMNIPDGRAEDDLLQLYTSGTTGRPKGVRLTNTNIASVWSMSSAVAGFDYTEDDKVLTVMPQFHIAGINSGLLSLLNGATMAVAREFTPENVLGLIETYRCTRAFFVPSMIIMLLDHPGLSRERCATLNEIAYGGAAITGNLLARARARLGCEFAQLYGMTETSGAGTFLSPADHDLHEKTGSCGRAWPGLTLGVVDDDLQPVSAGQKGQLVIKGATVTTGYWNNEDATAKAFSPEGLLTGDGAYIDEDGYVFIQDRIKDMIITGGENVAPTEVEDAIAGCPGVRDVAVIGVPSDRWGEEIRACIVPDSTTPATAEEILGWARQRIASFKLPKSIEFVDAIPRNASGKVLRRELREQRTP